MAAEQRHPEPHHYTAHVTWEGNHGTGTATYSGYGREHTIAVAGKPDLAGSADPAFRGTADRHNPEDLFVASIAACHMLSYLALCAREGVRVLSYEDNATGVLRLERGGGGRFEDVTLHPTVVIDAKSDRDVAYRLHQTAHEKCFIASSCSMPIRHEPAVHLAGSAPSAANDGSP